MRRLKVTLCNWGAQCPSLLGPWVALLQYRLLHPRQILVWHKQMQDYRVYWVPLKLELKDKSKALLCLPILPALQATFITKHSHQAFRVEKDRKDFPNFPCFKWLSSPDMQCKPKSIIHSQLCTGPPEIIQLVPVGMLLNTDPQRPNPETLVNFSTKQLIRLKDFTYDWQVKVCGKLCWNKEQT